MSTRKTKPAPSLADDLHQARGMLAAIYGEAFPETHPVLLFLASLWLALDRILRAVQASAQADDWKSSQTAAIAKGRELGIEARPGESQPEYCARVAAAMRERGPE